MSPHLSSPVAQRRGAVAKVLLIIVAVLVLVIGVGLFLLPGIAAGFVAGSYPVQRGDKTYTATVKDVSLSWGGPQKVGSVQMTDASGAVMADLQADAGASLLGLVLGGGDLGEINLSGSVNVREDQLPASTVTQPPVVDATKPAPPPSKATPQPVKIPPGTRFTFNVKAIDITYTPAAPGAKPVVIDDLDATLDFSVRGGATLAVKARTPALNVDGRASNLFDTSGVMTLPQSDLTLSAGLEAPGDLIDALVRLATKSAQAVTTTPGPARASLAVVAKGGRLRLADPSKPIVFEGSVPASLVEAFAGDGAQVSLTSDPTLKAVVSALDLPLPDTSGSGAPMDFRGAGLRASFNTSAIEGSAVLSQAQSARSFRVEPVEFEASATDLAQLLTIKGRTRAMLDGTEAGALALDIEARGLLDDQGAPRSGMPGGLRAEATIKGVPARLADPFVKAMGFTMTEVVGETINASLTARTRDVSGASPSDAAIPPTDVALRIDASHLRGSANLVMDDARISAAGADPVRFESARLAPVLRAFLADKGFDFDGAGSATLMIADLDVPLTGEGRPDAARASATVTFDAGGVTITRGVGDRPLSIGSLKSAVTLRPGADPKANLDWSLVSQGDAPTTIKADLDLRNLLAHNAAGAQAITLTPETARPIGTLQISNLPSHLLGYLPENLRDAVARSIGPDVSIELTTRPGPSAADIDLDLAVKSQGLTGGGSASLVGRTLRTAPQGILLTMQRPGDLAQALMQGQQESPVESLAWSQPLAVSVSDLEVTLPDAGKAFNPGSAFAKVTLNTGGMDIALRDTGTGATVAQRRLGVQSLNTSLVHNPQSGAALTLAGEGQHAGQSFTMSGDITLGRLFDDAGAVSVGTINPQGRVEILGLPTVLAAVFDPKNGAIAREAVGPTLDLLVTAPAPPVDPTVGKTPDRSIALSARGQNLLATASAGVTGKTLAVGPTDVKLTLTPPLVAAALAAYSPDLSPRPALEGSPIVNAKVLPFNMNLGPDNKPDMKTLGTVRGSLTSDSDIVLRNLPGGTEGKPLAAGVRALLAGFAYVAQDVRQNVASMKLELFDPDQRGARLAFVEGEAAMLNPPPTFNLALKGVDTARVDQWLGRPMLTAEPLGEEAGIELVGTRESARDPQRIRATVESRRLNTVVSLTQQADRMTLDRPAALDWEMSPTWANAYIAPRDEQGQPTVTFEAPTRLRVELNELAIAAGDGVKPLKPDVFRLAAKASSPQISLRTADGQRVSFDQLSTNIGTDRTPGTLVFNLASQLMTEKGGTKSPVTVDGRVDRALLADGEVNADGATITANVKGAVPTAVLDALGNQKGLLVDLLGPSTSLNAQARDLSKNSGDLTVQVTTDNAKAALEGAVANNVLTTTKPANITLSRITKELSTRYIETLIPLMSGVEKTPDDQPATIDATNLTLPTDGNTRSLNGDVTVDMGTVRFTTSSWFGELLKIGGGKAGGKVGERLKPFVFKVREGIVTYDKIELPLGEFTVETRGKIDLNEQRMDIITFVPFSAVADEVLKGLGAIPGLDQITVLPIRTHGPFGRTKSEPQLDLIVKESLPGAIEKIIPPDLKKGVDDALKDIFKKKK